MRSGWQPYARDAQRTAQVIRHPSASPREVLLGTASDGVDLSRYAGRIRQSRQEVQVSLNWHSALYGDAQPKLGEVLALHLDGKLLWLGVIDSITDYRETRGDRTLTVIARSRDASPLWREVRRVTPVYPVLTDLTYLLEAVVASLGLAEQEYQLPRLRLHVPHSHTQLADLTAWQMLETILLVAGFEPMVDAVGVLRAVSRDITRDPDQTLAADRVLRITGSKARPPITAVRLSWLDPELSKVTQQDQVLAAATLTAGFFKLEQRQDVYWSDDRTQRAQDTRLVVKQSVNSGLLPVGKEEYKQVSDTQGRITVTTSAWVPGLATASIAAMLALSAVPDGVVVAGFGASTGVTIPAGRVSEAIAQAALLTVMMSLGTGVYEIHGTPYDYVHARNVTEAYDENAPAWVDHPLDIESDLICHEEHAQAVAVRELLYTVAAAQTWSVAIVDDPRIEYGDILALPDGSRLFVTDYARDLSRGAAAVLDIQGFRVK